MFCTKANNDKIPYLIPRASKTTKAWIKEDEGWRAMTSYVFVQAARPLAQQTVERQSVRRVSAAMHNAHYGDSMQLHMDHVCSRNQQPATTLLSNIAIVLHRHLFLLDTRASKAKN